MKRWLKLVFVIIIICTIFFNYSNDYNFLYCRETNNKVGIIDGELTAVPMNIKKSNIKGEIMGEDKTHGDYMLDFINSFTQNGLSIYYYNACDINGNISTESLIKALDWMVDNDVENVNISLSSKTYSKELDDWINEHEESIRIFASYNNLLNSRDYPAMYDAVIASGCDDSIGYKENDYLYKSNIIITFPSCKKYQGNSYLSLITMTKFLKEDSVKDKSEY